MSGHTVSRSRVRPIKLLDANIRQVMSTERLGGGLIAGVLSPIIESPTIEICNPPLSRTGDSREGLPDGNLNIIKQNGLHIANSIARMDGSDPEAKGCSFISGKTEEQERDNIQKWYQVCCFSFCLL